MFDIDAECPVTSLDLVENQGDVALLSSSSISVLSPDLTVDLSVSQQVNFFIRVTISGGAQEFLPALVNVCGGPPASGGETLSYS